jgi:hypothetical protein
MLISISMEGMHVSNSSVSTGRELAKENAKMRELQRGARKDAMIPTGGM